MISNIQKNVKVYKNKQELKKSKLKNTPILSFHAFNKENIKILKASNFTEALTILRDDILEYKRRVEEEKYYQNYAPKNSLKREKIKLIFNELTKKLDFLLNQSAKNYEKYIYKDDKAKERYEDLIGNPTAEFKSKREGYISTLTTRMTTIKELMLELTVRTDESKPEKFLTQMITEINRKELLAGAELEE